MTGTHTGRSSSSSSSSGNGGVGAVVNNLFADFPTGSNASLHVQFVDEVINLAIPEEQLGVIPSPPPGPMNVTDGNLSAEHVDLASIFGPKRQELTKVIPITVVYCIIFVTGIVGNISTCLVIARNKYMQTATNYYLFNLAIADLLVLVLGLPQETYTFWSAYPWIFGETFCVIRIMVAETSTYASILTITSFTIERYVAICYPMKAQTMSSLSRAIKVIILIWIISAVCSVPVVYQFGVVYYPDANNQSILESAQCNIEPSRAVPHIFEISTFLFFIFPMTVITVLYGLIGWAIRKSTLSRAGSDSSTHSQQNGTELRAQQQARARRAVLKMLVAVVVAFFVCWAPFHAQRLMVIYVEEWTPHLREVQGVLFYISGVLYYVSSTINPILYNIMSLKFRQAFRQTILRPCKRRKKRMSYMTYKFHPKPSITDTNFTLVNGVSPKGKDQRVQKHTSTSNNKSNSDTISGSSMRMIHDDAFQGIELEHMLAEIKGFPDVIPCRTCERPNSVVNNNYRPQISHAVTCS